MTIPATRLTQANEYKMRQPRTVLSVVARSFGLDAVLALAFENGGASNYEPSTRAQRLSVDDTTGARSAARTHRRVYVTAHGGVGIEMALAHSDAGLDNQNREWGSPEAFFEMVGTALYATVKNIAGTATRVARIAWSDDRADATGDLPSLDLTKIHRYGVELPPGGCGEVRFLIDGVLVHRSRTANTINEAAQMGGPCGPVIYNVGVPPAATGSIDLFALSVTRDGTPSESIYSASASKAATAPGVNVIAVRPEAAKEIGIKRLFLYASAATRFQVYRDAIDTDGSYNAVSGSEWTDTPGTLDQTYERLVFDTVVNGTIEIDTADLFAEDPLFWEDSETFARILRVRALESTATVRASVVWSESR